MRIRDFFSGLMAKKPEPEKPFVITGTKKDDRFLLALAEGLKPKGIKTTETYKLAKRIKPERLELAYRLDALVTRCVNFYALQVIGPGFELMDCSTKTKEFCKNFIEKTHLMEKLEDVVRDMCIYGNGWLEKLFNADNKLVDAVYVNGKYMDFIRDSFEFIKEDESGDILGYVFKTWTGQKKQLMPNQIAHFKLFGHGNELAIGFVEPLYSIIHDKYNTRKGISQAGWRAGHELLIGTVGDRPDPKTGYQGHKADSDFAAQLADELEDIKGKHKIVKPYWVTIEKLKGEQMDWSPLLNYFDSRICAAFGIPLELALGTIGTARRTTLEIATTRDLDRRIRSIQNKITIILQNSIFAEFKKQGSIKEIPNIRWHDITPADLNRQAKRLMEYRQIGLIKDEDLNNIKEIIFEEEGFPLAKVQKKELKGKGLEDLKEILSDFIIERKHITIEEAILFLKALKVSFPDETIIKLIDSLVEKIMLKTTGQQIPQESGGIDEIKKEEEKEEEYAEGI